jgi:hypothetical protein
VAFVLVCRCSYRHMHKDRAELSKLSCDLGSCLQRGQLIASIFAGTVEADWCRMLSHNVQMFPPPPLT